ncbi:MAG: hypothetical protein FD152_401 [Xanthobacteraceae bacterium]|nr:MAG: hypothetical protein FD152_401 [Xanthobacteraceae bacterium]
MNNTLDVGIGQFAVLLAEVLAQWPEPRGRVDQLHLAAPVDRFAVRQHPDIGGDAGVVEHVERQGDDGFQPVVLDDPAPHIAFALTRIAGEQRRAVVHLGDARTERRVVLHLRQHVRKEQHLPVAGARDEAVLGVACVLDQEARIAHAGLATHPLLIGLPALPVGRVRQHEVELLRREGVVRQRRPFRPTDDVVGLFAFALEQQISLGDSVGLAIDLLSEEVSGDLLAVLFSQFVQRFFGDRQHAAGAAGAVI